MRARKLPTVLMIMSGPHSGLRAALTAVICSVLVIGSETTLAQSPSDPVQDFCEVFIPLSNFDDPGSDCFLPPKLKKAEQDTNPWMVSLVDKRFESPKPFCGGVILSKEWILTTAFCVMSYKPSNIKGIVADTHMFAIDFWQQTVDVEEIFIHSSFDSFNQTNDIALLKVVPDFKLNRKVEPAVISQNVSRFFNGGDSCTSLGWIEVHEHRHCYPVLVETTLTTISNRECRKQYPTLISKEMVCASIGTTDFVCSGVWGGPLTCDGELVGIASWSNGCGDSFPFVFVKVSEYIDWIEGITG